MSDNHEGTPALGWAIVSAGNGQGWQVAEILAKEEVEGVTQYRVNFEVEGLTVVAEWPTKAKAKAMLKAAKETEKQMRPFWQMAIENEQRARNLLHAAVVAAARGEG